MTDKSIVATFNVRMVPMNAASAIKALRDAGIADFKLKTFMTVLVDRVVCRRAQVVALEINKRSAEYDQPDFIF